MAASFLHTLTSAFLLLLLTLTAEASTDPSDAAAMHAIANSMRADSALNWSPTSDPCTQWPKVRCDDGGKVTTIQIGNIRNLTGTLHPAVGNLSALQRLELQFVGLGGPLPSLKGLTNLAILLIHNNNFNSIPADFFNELSSLSVVSLDHNPFAKWVIPMGLKDCSALQNFTANNASVVGGVPGFFAEFEGLDTLALSNNGLLGGEIPRSFAGSGMKSLWLSGSGIGGGLDVIANMTSLKVVLLQSNKLVGPLPDFSMMGSLEQLNLRDNKLTGIVPASLTRLRSLTNVVLTNNLLQGPVPVFASGVELDLVPASESFCHDSSTACDPRVDVLLSIAGSFGYPLKFAQNWKGNDPCANWIGISCDRSGNITLVNFQNMNLTGVISPSFESLGSLQKLILADNNISGTIPQGLVNLKLLKVLDVSNNALSGDVPKFGDSVLVKKDGNPNIGKAVIDPADGSPPGSEGSSPSSGGSGRKSPTGVIVGSIVGSVVVIGVIGFLVFYYRKKKESNFCRIPIPSTMIHPQHSGSNVKLLQLSVGLNGSDTAGVSPSGPERLQGVEPVSLVIPIQVLIEATNNFSKDNILGSGGFGTVYKGEYSDDRIVAVKRMEAGAMGSKGLNEFKSEISVLTRVRHRHLVSLLGYCLEGNERILVYEYMPQGTLSRHLFDWEKSGLKPLEWKMRLGIALDVARGVEYLHSLMNESFIHRDLKPSNILLGNDMRAKVADFGLVRLAPEGMHCSVQTRIAGTFGYLAPEYAVTGRVTTKADVFSFGVILMELITGQKALDDTRAADDTHLVSWFRRMQLNDGIIKIVDPLIDLGDTETSTSVHAVSNLAGYCCVRDPHQRPDMSYVVSTISSLIEDWKPSEQNVYDDYAIAEGTSLTRALEAWDDFGDSMTDITQNSAPLR